MTVHGRTDNMAWRRAKAQAIRDAGGQCQLCGGALDPNAPRRTPMGTEVDHITPLASGGAPYDRQNLRAVHRWCHQRRDKGQPPRRVEVADTVPWVAPDPWVSCPTCPSPCSYVGRPASRCW
jgi:5-methylcytosine-specific restriction endonuclease McrA